MSNKLIPIFIVIGAIFSAGVIFEMWGPGFFPPREEQKVFKQKATSQDTSPDEQPLVVRCPYLVFVKDEILQYNRKSSDLANDLTKNWQEFNKKNISHEDFYRELQQIYNEFDGLVFKVKSLYANYKDEYPKDYLEYFDHLIRAVNLYVEVTWMIISQLEGGEIEEETKVTQMVRTANHSLDTTINKTPAEP